MTNALDLPPGVVVELYRRRWEAEKVFDQIKNKLGQKKAWATSLETRHGLTNQAEDARRRQRRKATQESCASAGTPLSSLVSSAQRATQRSVKFIHWLRQSPGDHATETTATLRLQQLYATS